MPHFVNQADHCKTGSPFVLNLEDALIALNPGIEKGLSMEGLLCVMLNKRWQIKELG